MWTKEDEYRMRLALTSAHQALENGFIPVGSVLITPNGHLIKGEKTGLIHPLFDHAERNGCQDALWAREGPRNLAGATVYSTLEPCVICMSHLMTTRVSRVVYCTKDPYGGGAYMVKSNERPLRFQDEYPHLEEGLLELQSCELLGTYFDEELKKKDQKNWSDPDNALVRHVYERLAALR